MNFEPPFKLHQSCEMLTVEILVERGIIEPPLDGNHGEKHPTASDYVDDGIPFIMASDLTNGRIDLEKCKFITSHTADTLRKGFAKENDVLLTHKATIGRTAIVPKLNSPYIILTPQVTYYRIKNPEILNPNYLKYYFESEFFQNILKTWAGAGSTRAYIGITAQLKLPVILPSIKMQNFIVDTVKPIDSKIEINTEINKTLESIPQTIFKSWFIDFDPVHAKVKAIKEGRDPELAAMATIAGKTEAEIQNLKVKGSKLADTLLQLDDLRSIASFFPDRFVSSQELGLIPEKWAVEKLDDLISINPTVRLTKKTKAAFVDMKALPLTGYSVDEVIVKEYSGGAKFQKGDVLLARITPCLENGKTAIVDFLNDNEIGFGSTEFIVLRGENNIKTPFIACLSRNEDFRAHCIQSMVGSSGRQRVQNSCFSNFFLAIPDIKELLVEFNKCADKIFEMITVNSKQSRVLKRTRDIILPKLISGEISINKIDPINHDLPTESNITECQDGN